MSNSSTNSNASGGGIGFAGLLTIAFIVLKLTGVIHWSWLWVLSPIWIGLAIGLAVLVIFLIVVAVKR
jgi:hypothetical protein